MKTKARIEMPDHKTSSPDLGTASTTPALALEETTKRRLADSKPTTFSATLRENIYYLRGRGALEISLVYGAILVAFSAWAIVDPTAFPFLTKENLSGVLSQSIPVLAILGIGVGVLMVCGEFDLSVGAMIGFAGVVFIRVANNHGWVVGAVCAVASTIGIGLVNGLIVVYTKIPSFIATLGMSFFWTGASIYINGLTPATFLPGVRTDTAVNVLAGDHGYFRSQLVWLLLVGAASWFFLHRHRAGNRLYAVGGNAAAAAAVSIKPRSVKLSGFAFLGLMVGIASVLIVGRTSGMQPGTTADYTLLAVAAAVVGGCSLTGGRGTVVGMVVGAALIQTIQNGLILAKAPGFYVQLFLGLAIVVAAVFNKFMEGKAQ
jgi:simple sugar transport system permease protein